ncbi:MAG: TetR family transcriptional regulator [Acidobacteriota bacterium]
MARPREHDAQAARDGAVQAFLQRGFAATSLADLEAATGLDRRQLYNEHGDKMGVFLQALDDFEQRASARFLGALEAREAGKAEIVETLNTFVELSATEEGRLGCLLCNTSREPVSRDDARVGDRVSAFFARIEKAYANALRNAVKVGDLELTAAGRRRHARHLMATHVAACVLSRGGVDRKTLRDVVTVALQPLR